jgi:hypothetical protein
MFPILAFLLEGSRLRIVWLSHACSASWAAAAEVIRNARDWQERMRRSSILRRATKSSVRD